MCQSGATRRPALARGNVAASRPPALTARKLLLQAIRDAQERRDAPLVVHDPEKNHFAHLVARADDLSSDVGGRQYWKPSAVSPEQPAGAIG